MEEVKILGVEDCSVRIVVCNKGLKEIPSSCTFCNLSFDCKKAFKVDSKELAKTFRKKHRSAGNNVSVTDCMCTERETEDREDPQIYVKRLDVIFPGGTHEDDYLREHGTSDYAS